MINRSQTAEQKLPSDSEIDEQLLALINATQIDRAAEVALTKAHNLDHLSAAEIMALFEEEDLETARQRQAMIDSDFAYAQSLVNDMTTTSSTTNNTISIATTVNNAAHPTHTPASNGIQLTTRVMPSHCPAYSTTHVVHGRVEANRQLTQAQVNTGSQSSSSSSSSHSVTQPGISDKEIVLQAWEKSKTAFLKYPKKGGVFSPKLSLKTQKKYYEKTFGRYESIIKGQEIGPMQYTLKSLLTKKGSLWSKGLASEAKCYRVTHFNNIFLHELDQISTRLYINIVSAFNNVQFYTGRVLYRRDTRPAATCFMGFELKPDENTPNTPKYKYAEWPNNGIGISCSDVVIAFTGQISHYYTIILPENHGIPFVKVSGSKWPEWNAMKKIPGEYVHSCTTDNATCVGGTVEHNPNFKGDASVLTRGLRR